MNSYGNYYQDHHYNIQIRANPITSENQESSVNTAAPNSPVTQTPPPITTTTTPMPSTVFIPETTSPAPILPNTVFVAEVAVPEVRDTTIAAVTTTLPMFTTVATPTLATGNV